MSSAFCDFMAGVASLHFALWFPDNKMNRIMAILIQRVNTADNIMELFENGHAHI